MQEEKMKIPSKVRSLFAPDEQAEFIDNEAYSFPELIRLYCQRSHQNNIEIEKQFSGTHDLSNSNIFFFKSFFPSSVARRSWLFLQTLLDVSFGNNYFTIRDNLDSWIILQTLEGAGKLTYEGKEYTISEGDIFIIDCHKLHDYRTFGSKRWHYRLAHFNGFSMPDFFSQIISTGNVVFHQETDSKFTELFDALFTLNLTDTPECELLSNSILTQMLTEIIQGLPQFDLDSYPQRIRDICEYLTQHCCEKLSIDMVAENFSISKYHLCREFKTYTGKTLFSYIEEGRINTAKQLLRHSDLTIAEISECVGFDNQSNFGRTFRKVEGISPTLFRKQWGGL